MFNPETVERHRNDGIEFVKASDYDLLLQYHREALDALLGMVTSNTDAMCVLSKAGLTDAKVLRMKSSNYF